MSDRAVPTTERPTLQEIREAFGVETRVELGYDRAGLELEYIQNFGKDPVAVRAAVLDALTQAAPPSPPSVSPEGTPVDVKQEWSEEEITTLMHIIGQAMGRVKKNSTRNEWNRIAGKVRRLRSSLSAPETAEK